VQYEEGVPENGRRAETCSRG